jgi:hypothetical protein
VPGGDPGNDVGVADRITQVGQRLDQDAKTHQVRVRVDVAGQPLAPPRSISRAPSLAAARMSALAPTATMRPLASSKQMASQTWPAVLHAITVPECKTTGLMGPLDP